MEKSYSIYYLAYGFVIKPAGPMKNCEIPPMRSPLMMNILVPCITVYALEVLLQTISKKQVWSHSQTCPTAFQLRDLKVHLL